MASAFQFRFGDDFEEQIAGAIQGCTQRDRWQDSKRSRLHVGPL
jgi:hypothetical protein